MCPPVFDLLHACEKSLHVKDGIECDHLLSTFSEHKKIYCHAGCKVSTVSLVTEYMSLVNLAGEMCGNTMILKVTTYFYLLIIHFYFFELTDSKFLFVQDNKH